MSVSPLSPPPPPPPPPPDLGTLPGGGSSPGVSPTPGTPGFSYVSSSGEVDQNGRIKLTIKYKDATGKEVSTEKNLNVKVGGEIVRDYATVVRIANTFNETLVFKNMADEFLKAEAEKTHHSVSSSPPPKTPVLSFKITDTGFTVKRLNQPTTPVKNVDFIDKSIKHIYQDLFVARDQAIKEAEKQVEFKGKLNNLYNELLKTYAPKQIVRVLKVILEEDSIKIVSPGTSRPGFDSNSSLRENLGDPVNKWLLSELQSKLDEAELQHKRVGSVFGGKRDIPEESVKPLVELIRENASPPGSAVLGVSARGEVEISESASSSLADSTYTFKVHKEFQLTDTEKRTSDAAIHAIPRLPSSEEMETADLQKKLKADVPLGELDTTASNALWDKVFQHIETAWTDDPSGNVVYNPTAIESMTDSELLLLQNKLPTILKTVGSNARVPLWRYEALYDDVNANILHRRLARAVGRTTVSSREERSLPPHLELSSSHLSSESPSREFLSRLPNLDSFSNHVVSPNAPSPAMAIVAQQPEMLKQQVLSYIRTPDVRQIEAWTIDDKVAIQAMLPQMRLAAANDEDRGRYGALIIRVNVSILNWSKEKAGELAGKSSENLQGSIWGLSHPQRLAIWTHLPDIRHERSDVYDKITTTLAFTMEASDEIPSSEVTQFIRDVVRAGVGTTPSKRQIQEELMKLSPGTRVKLQLWLPKIAENSMLLSPASDRGRPLCAPELSNTILDILREDYNPDGSIKSVGDPWVSPAVFSLLPTPNFESRHNPVVPPITSPPQSSTPQSGDSSSLRDQVWKCIQETDSQKVADQVRAWSPREKQRIRSILVSIQNDVAEKDKTRYNVLCSQIEDSIPVHRPFPATPDRIERGGPPPV